MVNANSNSNGKKKVVGIVAAACAATMAVAGSLALFTDTASVSGTTKAGNVSIGISSDASLENGDFSGQLKNTSDKFTTAVQNMNPGDSRNLTFDLNNTGDKAIYTNDEMTLTVTPNDAYKNETGAAPNIDSVPITIDGMNLNKDRSTFDAVSGKYVLVYTGAETVLSGGSGDGRDEIVKDHTATSVKRDYTLKFNEAAGNYYQNADIKLDVKVDAVQYANTDGLTGKTITAESVKTDADGKVNG